MFLFIAAGDGVCAGDPVDSLLNAAGEDVKCGFAPDRVLPRVRRASMSVNWQGPGTESEQVPISCSCRQH
jgi:hypothetical protein